MNWYIAKIIYEIICGDGSHSPQFDEQLRLLQATDAAEAFDQANEIGLTESLRFQNDRQQLVEWKFIGVPELHLLETNAHGAELFSRIREVDNASHYREIILGRAKNLQQNKTTCQEYHFLT
ncbi:DUF4288 domain-containing protein [Flavihumibacter petaseus]|uniref:DUF4288 domain-containing protein n=1 Tax=Flavihumibacter petaseus NBRC 106054 TaxID=1220578 RepID=A0A0E9MVU2_9BACT|nr:DUF4288 domain-containing protein [Flavihumibacter petaseus]GAO41613.1 hypothetical protein FPE01S_01_06270 [Flavihumibacter petaseus NBRC 106054]